MSLGILGRKLGMTQINVADERLAVTLVEAGPCIIVQKKTLENDGYTAIKVAFGPEIKDTRSNKAEKGIYKKLNIKPRKNLLEFRISSEKLAGFEEGQEIKISDVFTEGQYVDVVGTTKGRGFTGVMKGWNMKGFRATHGTHEFFRHAGSIGCRAWPGRVWKNKKMPGNYGNERTTIQNLRIVKILSEENCVAISGAVPGAKNGLLEVYPSVRYGHIVAA